jgi:superfamily II DNA or RNA helicase
VTPFAVGSLVRARGREWVVLPESDDELVMLRPLGGGDREVTGVLRALENVVPATFDPPDPSRPGDWRSARLLRDALGFRSSAGPFRSFGHLAVDPRPYQLVPLLMALKLDPVRLLIADDVGIGKTVEAALIAGEMLEQGDASRLAVLCPPHLAEQWQQELASKFHIEAELVLAGTAARLERGLPVGTTIFDRHPYVIVSTDFIKADRYRQDFLRTCPDLVIVDEAHTCAADPGTKGKASHQRHELVRSLAAAPDRHLILVTATPHSGKEGAFRSLLSLLDPTFADLPEDLRGDANRRHRERLAAHLVQRRRADIRAYLEADTPFPVRKETEQTYELTPEYAALFDRVLRYARETVRDPDQDRRRQRVRWWSALALLRSLASSPAAAAATLRTRANTADTETPEEADEVGRRTVLDLGEDEEAESPDVVSGADPDLDDGGNARRRLRAMAKDADALLGDRDRKLVRAAGLLKTMINDGYNPIVFCRFIPTAEYVAEQLRGRLPKGVEVTAVTGILPPAEREARIEALAEHVRRVLVATDCLSEGINLQDKFDAVFHYDLPWNPTRLEQREGRVDRFGQLAPEVRVITYYGSDNLIDQIVVDVLVRKHRAIRSALGISVPVPGDTTSVIDALTEGVLLRNEEAINQPLPGMEEWVRPAAEQLQGEWEDAADKEKRSRAVFAQHTIDPSEVARELDAVRDAVGSEADVEDFVRTAVEANGGVVSDVARGSVAIDLGGAPANLVDAVAGKRSLKARFQLPPGDGERYLGRTEPFVAGLASYVLDAALDPIADSPARRCGLLRTDAVTVRTTLLLVRYRFHIVTTSGGEERPLLAEDSGLLAFTGSPSSPTWLSPAAASSLLRAAPTANVNAGQASDVVGEVVAGVADLRPSVDDDARRRADELLAAHQRVRQAARQRGVRFRVEPQLPPDLLGVYVFLPGPAAPASNSR